MRWSKGWLMVTTLVLLLSATSLIGVSYVLYIDWKRWDYFKKNNAYGEIQGADWSRRHHAHGLWWHQHRAALHVWHLSINQRLDQMVKHEKGLRLVDFSKVQSPVGNHLPCVYYQLTWRGSFASVLLYLRYLKQHNNNVIESIHWSTLPGGLQQLRMQCGMCHV